MCAILRRTVGPDGDQAEQVLASPIPSERVPLEVEEHVPRGRCGQSYKPVVRCDGKELVDGTSLQPSRELYAGLLGNPCVRVDGATLRSKWQGQWEGGQRPQRGHPGGFELTSL